MILDRTSDLAEKIQLTFNIGDVLETYEHSVIWINIFLYGEKGLWYFLSVDQEDNFIYFQYTQRDIEYCKARKINV